ncbi:hypothetical protein [Streptomyces griseus]|uniref:hypothetical protein n=1 Tax=Streptomyces griseus TaxID=1911 RepID=UPI000A834AB9
MTPEPYERPSPRTRDEEPRRSEELLRDEELFRDALRRTVDPLSLQPDLVADAVREGHRRRARARAFAVAGAFVAVTAVTLGLSVLGPWLSAGPGPEPVTPAGPSLSLPATTPTPSPRRTEHPTDMPSPTATPVPTESAAVPPEPSLSVPPGLGPQEAQRLEDFRRQTARTLGSLLPVSVGTVRPVGDGPGSYEGRRDGIVHTVRLTVRRDPGSPEPACRDLPEKGLTCEPVTLDDGTPAQAYRQPVADRPGTEVSLHYRSGRSTVALSVAPARSGLDGAAVTAGDLVRVAQDLRFRELIAYADEHPAAWSGAAS